MNWLLKTFFRIRKLLTQSKVWIQRSMSYIAIANSAMILFLLLSRLEEYGIELDIAKWFFPLLIGGLLIMILFGYIDDRLGFHREEHRTIAKKNPYFDEILSRLEKIETEMKKIKKR